MFSGGGSGGSSSAVRAGAAFVEIFVKPNYKGLDDVANRIGRFGAMISKLGLGVAGTGAALLTPLAFLFKGGLDMAGQLQDLQDQFGLTAEGASKLGYTAQVAGAGLEELEPILKGLSKANTEGKPLDQFAIEFADGLLAMEEGSERTNFAMEKLGKGGLKFLRIAGDIRKLFHEAPIFDQKTLDSADSFGQSLNKIMVYAKSALLPFAEQASTVAGVVADMVRQHASLIVTVAGVAVAMVGAGIAIAGTGSAIMGLAMGMKLLLFVWGGLSAILTSPFAAFVAVVVGAVYAVNRLTGIGDAVGRMFTGWGGTFASLKSIATDAISAISDALLAGDLGLAMKVAMAGLNLAWQVGLGELMLKWQRFKFDFMDTSLELGNGFTGVFAGALSGLKLMVVNFAAWVVTKVTELFQELTGPTIAMVRLFSKDMADGLQKVADTLLTPAQIEMKRKAVEAGIFADDRRNQDALKAQAELERLQANAGRNGAALSPEQQQAIDDARAAFNRARDDAEIARFNKEIADLEAAADAQVGAHGFASDLAASVRGAFQIGNNAFQQFGNGDPINRGILKAAEKQVEQNDAMLQEMREFNRWAHGLAGLTYD